VTVTISPTNAAPIAGTPSVTTNPITGIVSGNVKAVDPDKDALTYIAGSATSAKGTATVTATGDYTYTPIAAARHAAAREGATAADTTDVFIVDVADNYGAISPISFSVNVSPFNTAPSARITSQSEPDPLTGVVTGTMTVSDADGDDVYYSVTTSTAKGSIAYTPEGNFTYTPTADARSAAAKPTATAADKSDTFVVTFTDRYGGTAAVPVTIAINPLRAAPVVIATVRVVPSPQGVAVSPDGTRVYVTSFLDKAAGGGSLSVIDTANNTAFATIAAGEYAMGVVFHPDGSRAYVANYQSGSVSVINTAVNGGALATTIKLATGTGTSPTDLAISPDGSRLYTANFRGNSVSVINTATNKVIAVVAVGSSPRGLAVSPDGKRIYVTNLASNSVSVISTATNQVTDTINVGPYPDSVILSPDGSRAYVVKGSGTVSVINTSTKQVTDVFSSSNGGGRGIAISPDGALLYMAQGGAVVVIDTASNQISATVPVGGVDSLAISRDGTRLYVTDRNKKTMSVLSL
jgi:YVTN family beta-propeller protein/VCBS repeat-containing protein